MSIISTNPTLQFAMPGGGVNLNAIWSTTVSPTIYFDITPGGSVSASNTLRSFPNGSIDLVIPEVMFGIRVTGFDYNGFDRCHPLRSVVIPSIITTIPSKTFSECAQLQSIYIPDSVYAIGFWAFNGCNALTSIDIPSSVTGINVDTFSGCTALTTININKPKDSITGAPWSAPNATINWLG